MRRTILRSTVFAVALFSAVPAGAQVLVGSASPNTGNCYPIGCYTGYNRYQNAYNANAFSGIIDIGAFDLFHTVYQPGQGTYADGTYIFSFGITSNSPNGLNANQDLNANVSPLQYFATLVLSGTSAVPSMITVTGGPYLYDPSLGNLLLDVQMSQTGTGGGVYNNTDQSCSGQTGRVYGSTGSGAPACDGLVTQFDVATTSAPEPASIALVATGLLGVIGVARRRRNANVA
jgi:hypothetical protein